MKKLLLPLVFVLALSCKKDKEGCVWNVGNGDYYDADDYSKQEVAQKCNCTPVLECP
jgi:hypothetical protein